MNSSERSVENSSDLLRDFNLSRSKRLRTLETTAEAIDHAQDITSCFFKTILSSSIPSLPLDLIIIYRDFDLGGSTFCLWSCPGICFRHKTWGSEERNASYQQQRLGVFCGVHNVRDFRLVLCADVSDCMVEHGIGVLEQVAKAGQFFHEPLVIAERRTLHTRYADPHTGWMSRGYIFASAL